MAQRVELPVTTPVNVTEESLQILVVRDFIRQVDQNLQEQEAKIKQLQEQREIMHQHLIGSRAQKHLLDQLLKQLLAIQPPAPPAPPAEEVAETAQETQAEQTAQ